jgi:hypothetical protein
MRYLAPEVNKNLQIATMQGNFDVHNGAYLTGWSRQSDVWKILKAGSPPSFGEKAGVFERSPFFFCK